MSRFLLLMLIGFSSLGLSCSGKEISFVCYNLRNFAPLLEKPGSTKPLKSEKSAAAVIATLKELDADVLGLVEMGSEVQFEEFRRRMKAAGLDYPHYEWVGGADPDRHLVLLSRLPIVSRQSKGEVPFQANGQREKMRRGILDVTVQATKKVPLRILGVHLKSKLALSEDEELIRRHEAHLLRRHIDAILEHDPKTYLLLFGDFNDTKNRPSLHEIAGQKGAETTLLPLVLSDPQGDRWTHYWAAADSYTRIDFLFVNRRLAPHLQHDASYIHRAADWLIASDHRPLVASFKFDEF